MFDAEDTEVFPTTPEVEAVTLPTDNVTLPEDVSIIESPDEAARPSAEQIKSPSNASSTDKTDRIPMNSGDDGNGPKIDKKQTKESNKTKDRKLQPCPPPQSRCRVRSRDTRQCKKHFREMIGKHEIRNDELEQRETDLRQRLEMLECSMPAVMVWNIWRMAQGAPVSHLREIVAKQFLEPTAGFPTCPSTPSQHWDCRVREVEAERKQAQHRAEEARQVFAVKGDALKLKKQQIAEARKLQEERKMQIAKLEEEVKRLQDALKKAQGDDNFCETGDCGEIQCRQMWLQGVSSVSSIHSTDLECLARLQDLAEAELCMKRQIADLERRECAYMRTLQQADEMWAKMEDDNASNLGDLREQLNAKIAANQQLADRIVELEDEIEKLRTQLTKAVGALGEYTGKTFTDVGLGDVNISTEEKIEQTEDEPKDIEVSEKDEIENVMAVEKYETTKVTSENETEGTKLSEGGPAEFNIVEQFREDIGTNYISIDESEQMQFRVPEIEDRTLIAAEVKEKIKDLMIVDEKPDYRQIQVATEISTKEESVQAKPEIKEVGTQSIPKKPSAKKETTPEKQSQIQITTITEAVGDEGMAAVAEVGLEVSMNHLAKQQQGITALGQALETEAEHVDELAITADGSRLSKNKGSLAHLLKAPTEDKDTEVRSVTAKTSDDSTDQKKTFQVTPEAVTEQTTEPTYEDGPKATTPGLAHKLTDKDPYEVTSNSVFKPVAKVPIKAVPEPVAEASGVAISSPEPTLTVSSVPTIEATAIKSPELPVDADPRLVSKINPIAFPAPTTEATPRLALEPVIDAVSIPPPEPVVEVADKPVLEQTLEVMQPMEMNLAGNTLSVPIQTLLFWHNITACVHQQILICPQCSSTGGEIGQMLNEIRSCLGKDAPDFSKIECAKNSEAIENPVAVPNKKGPCICKPKSCPLNGALAAVPPQANVQSQTVVDGQSQTSVLVKIPSRETRSSKSSKSSTKSKEEVKLTSIEEGTEPDSRMRHGRPIPDSKDEATVTVGDIASQTETIRKTPSVSKYDDQTCVCPTGVCPKKNVKPPRGECKPEKFCASSKKSQGKEYKSTADAILAPAIRVVPSNEYGSSSAVNDAKNDDMNSESSAFACCMCGKPITPVASRKTTAIPMPTKSFSRSKVILASEGSVDDFLCCACRVKNSPSARPKGLSTSKYSAKSMERARVSQRSKPVLGNIKTSCSREICCSCDKPEIHVLTETLITETEVSKSKTRPETKDVCCLAKISRDKALKAESRRRKDKDSIRIATPSVSQSGSGQLSSTSSACKESRTNDSSDSNVCCSSIKQVVNLMKKKGKGNKCACDGQEGNINKEGCVCGEDDRSMEIKQTKHNESSASCICPPNLFG